MSDPKKEAVMRINAELSKSLTDQSIGHEPMLEASADYDSHVQQTVKYEELLKRHQQAGTADQEQPPSEKPSETALTIQAMREAIQQIQDLTARSEKTIEQVRKITFAETAEKDRVIESLKREIAAVATSEHNTTKELQKTKMQYEELQEKMPDAGKYVHQGWKWGCIIALVALSIVVLVWVIVSSRTSNRSPILENPSSVPQRTWEDLPSIPPVR